MLRRDAAGRSLWVLYVHLGYGELRPACFTPGLGDDADLRLRWNPLLRGLLEALGPNADYLDSGTWKVFLHYARQLGEPVSRMLQDEAVVPYRRPRPKRRR